jgi:hypothetical protein
LLRAVEKSKPQLFPQPAPPFYYSIEIKNYDGARAGPMSTVNNIIDT